MNDRRFLEANRTGIFKVVKPDGSVLIPKEVRARVNIEGNVLVEIIPMNEGVYIRKAVGKN